MLPLEVISEQFNFKYLEKHSLGHVGDDFGKSKMMNLLTRQPQREALMHINNKSASIRSNLGTITFHIKKCCFCQIQLPQQEALTDLCLQVKAQVRAISNDFSKIMVKKCL